MPRCDYNCGRAAAYDFVDKAGHWRYGCIGHWTDNRLSKQLGPGHGRHLVAGVQPEPHPEGQPEVDVHLLARPRVAPMLIRKLGYEPSASGNWPIPKSKSTMQKANKEHAEKRVVRKQFFDMEPTSDEVKIPKAGTVLAVTLDLCRDTPGGATLEEIQAAIGPKHPALKLLEWANQNKGMGWRQDPETKRIVPVYRGAGPV
jgi:hypothetical protein